MPLILNENVNESNYRLGILDQIRAQRSYVTDCRLCFGDDLEVARDTMDAWSMFLWRELFL
ncbi:hypothetical protein DL89DRAFT_265006, partial [Linderina pennispora]